MTRTLVTGGAGFIGSEVVRALAGRGDHVSVVVRPGGSRARLAGLAVEVHEASLDDAGAIRLVVERARPDAVVHLAWHAHPDDYLTSIQNVASLAASAHLFEAVLGAGCRKLVGVGTCLEYASSDVRRTESDRLDPRSLYASCKASAWLVARSLAAQRGAELTWARVFHVHGPSEHPARLIPRVAASLRAGEPVSLSPGDQIRDHLHVADVGAAIARLTSPGLPGAYNVCSGAPVSLGSVLRTVGEIIGRPDLLRFGERPYAPDEIAFLAGDPDRLLATGWRPRFTTLREGLAYLETGPS